MDLKLLFQKLVETRIRKDFYSLSGGLPNEAYCINKTQDGWEVYYSERGLKSNLKLFKEESAACEYFYRQITSDFVVMNNLEP